MDFTANDIYSKVPNDIEYAIIILVNMPVFGDSALVSFDNNRFERGYTSVMFYEKSGDCNTCIRFRSKKSSLLASIMKAKNGTAIITDASKDKHNVACVFPLDRNAYLAAKSYADTCDRHYDTATANCTTFAVQILERAGIKISIEPQNWVITEKEARDFKKYARLPFFSVRQIQHFFSWLIRKRRGYTPADFGLYLISGECEAEHILIYFC